MPTQSDVKFVTIELSDFFFFSIEPSLTTRYSVEKQQIDSKIRKLVVILRKAEIRYS